MSFMTISAWEADKDQGKEVPEGITGSKYIAHLGDGISRIKVGVGENRRNGIWLIMCWDIFKRRTGTDGRGHEIRSLCSEGDCDRQYRGCNERDTGKRREK